MNKMRNLSILVCLAFGYVFAENKKETALKPMDDQEKAVFDHVLDATNITAGPGGYKENDRTAAIIGFKQYFITCVRKDFANEQTYSCNCFEHNSAKKIVIKDQEKLFKILNAYLETSIARQKMDFFIKQLDSLRAEQEKKIFNSILL
jgi:hypothetical protein